ncbi:hypothetical protein CR513_07671, partial [Mucuna pruriens]
MVILAINKLIQTQVNRKKEVGERLSEGEDVVNMALVDSSEPITIKIAKWRQAMEAKITAIENNQIWKLVELPNGAKKTRVKWIYKTK